jgi:hypothetical protein
LLAKILDDWIIKYGDVGNDMYMISRGTVAVYGANDEFLCELHEGTSNYSGVSLQYVNI